MNNYGKSASMLSALALAMTMGAASAQTGSAGAGGQGGGNTATTMTFQSWLNMHSGNGKRMTRQQYMDEAQRRWDMMDTSKQGLTYDEINRTYYSGVGMGGPTTTSAMDKKGIKQ